MRTYQDAWRSFYSLEHIKTIFCRRLAEGHSIRKIRGQMIWFCGAMFAEGVHPLQAGIIRRKHRLERRPSFPRESVPVFAWRRIKETSVTTFKTLKLVLRLHRLKRLVERDPEMAGYVDRAITPVKKNRADLRVYSTHSDANPVVKLNA